MTLDCCSSICNKFDMFAVQMEKNANRHPALCVTLAHEFMRNLYPSDPYIPLPSGVHPLVNMDAILDRLIGIFELWEGMGSYFHSGLPKWTSEGDLKERTGKVYSVLWDRYAGDMVSEAEKIITERFSGSEIDFSVFKNKVVLDAGCGSGRYSCALARMGAAEVVGLDWSDGGIRKAKELAEENNIRNVRFEKGSLLDKPFEDGTFDFVFSNGVYHHTGDIAIGTKEMFRVMKSGGKAWYYIYGAGGLFWYARKAMNRIMKAIPQDFAISVLTHLGMPQNRFIFCDNWYVPVEEHTTVDSAETMFADVGFSQWRRCVGGRKTDFDHLAVHGSEMDRQMWGEGQLRYLLTK